jgi:hypothetical protein
LGYPSEALAVLNIAGRTFCVGSVRGHEDEGFGVIDTPAESFRQVLYVSSGGCRGFVRRGV